jgi:adhesin transport system outer membrane protein
LLLFSSVASSQSLDDAVRSALLQYPTIIAAQARLESSQSDIIRAQSQHYPQLSWRGTSSNYSGVQAGGGAQASGFSPDNTWIQSPNVTLNIWAGGKIQADVDKSKSNSVLRFNQQRITRDEVALLAVEGYLSWARAIDLVSQAQANVTVHRKILSDIKKITEVDQGRMIDHFQAEVRLESALIVLKQREVDLAIALQRLERMLQATAPLVPSGVQHIKGVLPVSEKAALSFINDLHPAIAAKQAQIDAARATLAGARSEYSPTVNVSYGKQISQGSGQGDYITQLTINFPIFEGGATYGAVGSASSLLVAAQQGLTETRLLLTERVLSIWPELKASRVRKDIALRQTQTGIAIVKGYGQQFLIGQRSLLDLLTVQNDLFGYQTRATLANFDELLAKARMLSAIGTLANVYLSSQEVSHTELDPSSTHKTQLINSVVPSTESAASTSVSSDENRVLFGSYHSTSQ